MGSIIQGKRAHHSTLSQRAIGFCSQAVGSGSEDRFGNEPRHMCAEGVMPRRRWVRSVATDVEIAVAVIGCSADSTRAGFTFPWKINLKHLLRTEPVCVVAITVAAMPSTR